MLDIVLGIGDIGEKVKLWNLYSMEYGTYILEEKRPKINKQVNKRGEKVIIENKERELRVDRGRKDGSGIY